ncbi:hypothetical protein O9H85_32800 [Paenibacillus filicis]|uniref:Uncharacterized protein n=1 Tax=Paenibacillus gyeongsangnamensis TaxID=3388067 RepID=A0ABT4QJJ5_9BACL|nr:hypothetical protein [Paenibacillus filicis]MCZ8517051.1 hypothetical protein [Paenibacillus filicis]
MPILIRQKRLVWITTGVIFAFAILYALAFVNDTPGGLSDWRMSHAMGLNGTIRIPLGKTPEDAIRKFRHFPSMQVIHQEPVEGGLLLFIKRFYEQDGNDLQVEYVRKTWLGWKWAWGGGYGIGGSKSPLSAKSALNYMSMPKVKSLSTPFPMVFGDVLDSSVKKVTVEVKGKGTGTSKYTAKLTGMGHMIWFVFLPSSDSTPFDINGFNQEGNLIAYKTINDPNDYGSIDLRN